MPSVHPTARPARPKRKSPPIPQLFSRGKADSPAYRNLRRGATPEARAARSFSEHLWQKFWPDADKEFVVEIRRDFHPRFWEMYLTIALREFALVNGYSVSSPKPGPDLLLKSGGHRIWIEAVAASAGDPSKPDSLSEPKVGTGYTVPEEKIILRYTSALVEKFRKYCKYRSSGIVNADDAYVIAVNGYALPFVWSDGEIPRILKALFPLGSLEVTFNRRTNAIIDSRHQFRPAITKAGGGVVSTEFFADAKHSGVSAVLFSRANAGMWKFPLGSDFLVIHNPHATQCIPRGLLPSCREYEVVKTADADLVMSLRGTALASPDIRRSRDCGREVDRATPFAGGGGGRRLPRRAP